MHEQKIDLEIERLRGVLQGWPFNDTLIR